MEKAAQKAGYVYAIRSVELDLEYVGLHGSADFDRTYFGSPVSKTGLAALYRELWPRSNKLGYKIPNFDSFSQHFEIRVLEWCETRADLFLREAYWIAELDTYANGLNRNGGAGFASVYGPSHERYCDPCERVTKWKGEDCYNCLHAGLRSKSYCDSCEAETTHTGTACVPCSFLAVTTLVHCALCAKDTKHRSGVCQRCVVLETLRQGDCDLHGLTIFSGETCRKCISGKGELKHCDRCVLETLHMRDRCMICAARDDIDLRECSKHGLVPHRGESCFTCVSQRSQSRRFCEACQEERPHRGDNCMSCSYRKTLELLSCSVCEKSTNHQNGTCLTCKARHRKHKVQPDSACAICIAAAIQ